MTEKEIFDMLDSLGNEEIECDEVPDEYWENPQFVGNLVNNNWDDYFYENVVLFDLKEFWLESLPNYLECPDDRGDVAWKVPTELWNDAKFAKELLDIFPAWKEEYDCMVRNGWVKPEEKRHKFLFSNAPNAEKLRLEGVEFRKQGNYEQALASYAKALELTPNNARVYSNIGTAYYSQKNYKMAINNLNRAIELKPTGQLPDEGDYYYNRGAAYKESGRIDLAILDFKKAQELNPGHALAKEELNTLNAEDKNSSPPPLPSAKPWKKLPPVQYYVGINEQQAGPFGWEELDGLVKKGELTAQTLVWKKGFADWVAAHSVDELKIIFK